VATPPTLTTLAEAVSRDRETFQAWLDEHVLAAVPTP
jgi:primosomal protein N''